MNNYGYYTLERKPGETAIIEYPARNTQLCFLGYPGSTVVIHHQYPSLTFEIANERLALIMEHA
jgi:hypothetical protein